MLDQCDKTMLSIGLCYNTLQYCPQIHHLTHHWTMLQLLRELFEMLVEIFSAIAKCSYELL